MTIMIGTTQLFFIRWAKFALHINPMQDDARV